jgi:hypothetical protein
MIIRKEDGGLRLRLVRPTRFPWNSDVEAMTSRASDNRDEQHFLKVDRFDLPVTTVKRKRRHRGLRSFIFPVWLQL